MENNKLSYHSNFNIVYLRYKLKKGTVNMNSSLYMSNNLGNKQKNYKNKLRIIKNICNTKSSTYIEKASKKSSTNLIKKSNLRFISIKRNKNNSVNLNLDNKNILDTTIKKNHNTFLIKKKIKPVFSKHTSKIPVNNRSFNNFYDKNWINKEISSNIQKIIKNKTSFIKEKMEENKVKLNNKYNLDNINRLNKNIRKTVNLTNNHNLILNRKKKSRSVEFFKKTTLKYFNTIGKNQIKKKKTKKKKIKKNKVYATKWTKIINFLLYIPDIKPCTEIGYYSYNKIYDEKPTKKYIDINAISNFIYKLKEDILKTKQF